jgi:hypothetical protein
MALEKSDGKSDKLIDVGRGVELIHLHIVCLCDPSSGQIIHRHTIGVLKGGPAISEAEAIKEAFTRAENFYARIEKDPEEKRMMTANGRTLFPFDKLKAVVSNDPQHMGLSLRFDPKAGKLVEAEQENERPKRKASAH